MRSCAIATILTAASISVFFFACGPSQSPGQTAATAGSGTPATPASAPTEGAGPTTTTTATLGNNGDLQGSKLQTSSSSTVASPSSSTVPKGPHTNDPGRSRDDLRAIIQSHRDEARACYDAGLKNHPGVEGDLVIKWKIDPTGVVTDIGVDTTHSQILEPSIGNCISDVIKKIKFAPSPGGYETQANYPFNFHPHRATTGPNPGQPQ